MNNSIIDSIGIQSKTLGKMMAATVYVPANHTYSLPVLYFMHGRSGDENIIHALDIQYVADKMIAEGRMRPMLIACPRMEDALGLNAHEDYFFNEVMPLIEQRYKISKRFIGGCSAGGYIALNYALRHPVMFSRVGGHMPAIEESLDDEDLHYFGTRNVWEANNPLFLARQSQLSSNIKFYLDAGDKDEGGFYRGCSLLAEILKARGIQVENHLNKGHHNIQYIKDNLESYFRFYSILKNDNEVLH